MRHAFFMLVLMFCAYADAQDAGIIGTWQLQTPQLWQQLELNSDGTYQRSIKTAGSQRTEVGRWHGSISLLAFEPDHVITAQGARVPLPPSETHIDIAGVDATTLTLYYDGNAMEIWRRQLPVVSLSQIIAQSAALPVENEEPPPSRASHAATPPQLITMFMPQEQLIIEQPPLPALTVAEDPVVTEKKRAAENSAGTAKAPTSNDMYAEAKVVELITQIACEELRYPRRDLDKSEQRYKALAQSLGLESGDPAKLQRTLRHYQSNAEFMHAHQRAIAENSMRCVMATDQLSTRQ